ncbi:hypothetical protein S83_062520 [Arachis hypogaea]
MAGRCRTLNKAWRYKLSTTLFVKLNYQENKKRSTTLIIGVGYPPTNDNFQWLLRTNPQNGEQVQLNLPVNINHFGFYSMIGSDNGNLCIRFSQDGLNSMLLIWNPLTRNVNYVSDEAKKHCCHAVSLYAFGYLFDTIEYQILHVYKKHFFHKSMSWTLYNSFDAAWKDCGSFHSDVKKFGPNSVVDKGSIYWIGWEGVNYMEPSSIVIFSLQKKFTYEGKIPSHAKSLYHSLTHYNNGVGLMSYSNIGFTRQVVMWQLSHVDDNELGWHRMLKVSCIAMPYQPTLFLGKDIISVLEYRSSFCGSNDAERTDILVSKLKYMISRRDHILHHSWDENVNIKSYTLHSEGLYMV